MFLEKTAPSDAHFNVSFLTMFFLCGGPRRWEASRLNIVRVRYPLSDALAALQFLLMTFYFCVGHLLYSCSFFLASAHAGGQRRVSVVRVGGPRRREPCCHRGGDLGGGLGGSPRGRSRREQAYYRRQQCDYRCVYCCI